MARNGSEKITTVFGGMTFQAGARTAAHLAWTQERLTGVHPAAWVRVIQPCYNTGVAASAFTHDFDAVLDVEIIGMDDWMEEQRFFRVHGWADWVRTPAQGFSLHHHMVSIGYQPAPVGVFVPAQVVDYYNRALGLKDHHQAGSDPTWHPPDIDRTIFNYSMWLQDQEAKMPLNTDDMDKIRALLATFKTDLLDTVVDADTGTTLKTAAGRAARLPEKVDAVGTKVDAVSKKVGVTRRDIIDAINGV